MTIRRSGWEMTEGRAVNPLLISCSVTAVVSYVALVYLVTMERLEDPGLWTLEAVERLYDFANLLSDPPRPSNAYRTSCLRMSSWSARPSRLARFRFGRLGLGAGNSFFWRDQSPLPIPSGTRGGYAAVCRAPETSPPQVQAQKYRNSKANSLPLGCWLSRIKKLK